MEINIQYMSRHAPKPRIRERGFEFICDSVEPSPQHRSDHGRAVSSIVPKVGPPSPLLAANPASGTGRPRPRVNAQPGKPERLSRPDSQGGDPL